MEPRSERSTNLDQSKLEEKRRLGRERMARRRAAIKTMPPSVQYGINERARASRAKYRAQHRMELIIKERNRRENQSRANQNLDEFIRRCVRQNKAAQAAAKSEPHHSEAPEPDELMDDCWKLDRRLPEADGKIAPRTFLNSGYPVRYPDA